MNGTQVMAMGDDYFNTTGGFVPTTTSQTFTVSGNCSSCWSWPCACYTVYVPWNYTYSPSITLSMEQAEHLRKLAKNDRKLAEILRLFRPYIAVEAPDFA